MIKNEKEFINNINFLEHNIRNGINFGLFQTSKEIQNLIKQQAREKKTGRVYLIRTKNGKYKTHTASSGTETSARMSGKKSNNVNFKVDNLRSSIGVNKIVEYADFVEKGTKNMRARKDTSIAGNKICKEKLEINILNGIKSKLTNAFNN